MNVRTFFVGALLVAGTLPLMAPVARLAALRIPAATSVTPTEESPPEWPTSFRHQPLTQLPLTALGQRFAQRFPGSIARFTDGAAVLTVRHVNRPTRQLHPADDCFKALGYSVTRARPFVDEYEVQWSCFIAERDGQRARVCERIHDENGGQWIDTSAWFWAAQYGGGPWWATTVVTPEAAP